MRKLTIICLVMLLGFANFSAFAQEKRENRREKIEAAKTAFLTEKMELNKEQAEKFWPVYNEFSQKRRDTHKKSKVFKNKDLNSLSEKEIKESINKRLTLQQEQLNLEKEYVDKFLKVISAKQLAIMYQSEREFMRMILKRLDKRHSETPRRK